MGEGFPSTRAESSTSISYQVESIQFFLGFFLGGRVIVTCVTARLRGLNGIQTGGVYRINR